MAGCTLCAPAHATGSAVADAVEDAKLYFTAPLRWDSRDWAYFGGTLLVIGAAHEYDDNVRRHFGTVLAPTSGNADPHESRDWAPVAGMIGLTWAYATLLDSHDGYDEGRAMLESAAFSATTASLLKLAAGRRRPDETLKVDDWSRGGGSFPSMHVSVTFAVGAVLAESGNDEYRWLRRVLGYGLAAGVTYSRVHDGQHWMSDAVAGAALGTATGHFIVNRHDERRQRYSFGVVPLEGGAMVTCTFTPN